MDDYDAFLEGWSEFGHAAEGRAVAVFLSTGQRVWAVTVNELVGLRQMPAKAKGNES